MSLKNLFFAVFLVFSLQNVLAQKTISGVVTDAFKEPLGGTAVSVKGTSTGTSTDIDGKYSIKAKEGDVLVFSFIGTTPKEVRVGKSATINVVLEEEAQQIGEVVVVAYGTADKKSLTGAIATVSSDKIAQQQTTDVGKALEGAVAGVTISTSTGQPGQESSIRIRGIGSINASNQPLIVLDGVPYSGELSSINNNDVESISVLKDASSSALYGARGANGVIIITTKKGKRGALSVTFDTKVGFNSRGVPEYDIMTSPAEYYETAWESIYNRERIKAGVSDIDARNIASSADGLYKNLGYNIYNVANDQIIDPLTGKLNPNAQIKYADASNFNDWTGALFGIQARKEHNLSITKGTDKGSFYFSLGYLGDQGYNLNTYFDRYSTRFSYNGELLPWLQVNASSMLSFTQRQGGTTGSSYGNPFAWTRDIAPIYPVYVHNAQGDLVLNKGERVYDFGEVVTGVNGGRAYGSLTNPVATQAKNVRLDSNYYLNQSLGFDIDLLKDLVLSVNGNFYGNFYEYDYFTTPIGGAGKAYNGIGQKYRTNTTTLNFNQVLKYKKSFGDYNLDLLLGHESYRQKISELHGEKSNYVDPSNTQWNNAAKIAELKSYTIKHAVEGYLGQLNLNYDSRYYISGSFRRDGSSVFAPENRWGSFWSVGGSWRLDQEDFLKEVSWVDALKLKVSYGVQGNDNLYLPNSTTNRSWTPYLTLYTVTSDGSNPGLSASYKGRREITWEENANLNAGVEIALFKDRFTLDFDYFNKKTNNLLFNLPIPETTGFSTEPWNIGSMVNKGFEFAITGKPIRTKNVEWTLNFNALHYKNEVLELPEKFKTTGITRGSQRITEGGSIYDFYMVKWGGVNPDNGDAQYWILDAATNQFELKPSKDYEANSKQYVGTAIPDLQGGFGTSISFYNFDINAQFAYSLGGVILDSQYGGLMHAGTYGENWHTDIRNRWTPSNRNTDIPKIEAENQGLTQLSSRFLTDASYVAFRNINIGYTFPAETLQQIKLQRLRVFLAADNVALWSKRKGLDPRVSISGLNDNAVYSPIRTISAGAILTF